MKAVIALFALACVMAAENFFYDHNTGIMVYRTDDSCYVRRLTQDQQDLVHNHTIYTEYENDVRAAVEAGSTQTLAEADRTDFENHHCHGRQFFSV